MGEGGKIRSFKKADYERVCELYMKYMPPSFFAKLGEEFIRLLLKSQLESKWVISYVWERNNEVIGFITASTNCERVMFDSIKRYFWQFNWVLIKQVIKNPVLIKSIIETFFYFNRAGEKDIKPEMLYISVVPDHRNRKIGEYLIRRVLKELKSRGKRRVKVSTLAKNKPVNRLLLRLKFQVATKFNMYNKEMLLYKRELSSLL